MKVLQRAFGPGFRRPLGGDEPAVVVVVAAALLRGRLIGAGVGRIPPREAVLVDVRGLPGGAVRRLDAMELALVNRGVSGGSRHRGRVLETGIELDLRILRRRHAALERVLDAVLSREVPRQERRARRRAHARVGERVLEADAVPPQAREPGHVALRPSVREMLDRPLLISQEHEHVHARNRVVGRRSVGTDTRAGPGSDGASAQ